MRSSSSLYWTVLRGSLSLEIQTKIQIKIDNYLSYYKVIKIVNFNYHFYFINKYSAIAKASALRMSVVLYQ